MEIFDTSTKFEWFEDMEDIFQDDRRVYKCDRKEVPVSYHKFVRNCEGKSILALSDLVLLCSNTDNALEFHLVETAYDTLDNPKKVAVLSF